MFKAADQDVAIQPQWKPFRIRWSYCAFNTSLIEMAILMQPCGQSLSIEHIPEDYELRDLLFFHIILQGVSPTENILVNLHMKERLVQEDIQNVEEERLKQQRQEAWGA
ncbi:hypothetical protein AVEN_159793-1 [Araneus ventricosus]|uniref:Uncharacterized protein n=1 Tax=Araneus ventricosus TaxID=182803 RepID=A0A4Y2D9K5_ARAVE|nr:hypothetical protein AVEN_159793-1 [Araneus ventricosus]